MKRRRFFQSLTAAALTLPGTRLLGREHATQTLEMVPEDSGYYWELLRKSFPLTDERVYFNTGGLGPSPYQVIEAIDQKQLELETICETGHHYHEVVREKVAKFVGANTEEIAFTRNATEGMNFIARGVPLKAGDEIIMTTHEHPGGAVPWLAVAKQNDLRLKLIEPIHDAPQKMLELVEKTISPKTRVIMISHVPCTLGTVFPAKEICALAKARGLVTVLDGAQAVGQISIDLHDIGCDFYVTSGHKWLLGPKGTGFIYIAESAHEFYKPSFVGAYSDNGYDLNDMSLNFRQDAIVTEYGTRDAPKIWGIGAAVDFMQMIGKDRVQQRLHSLTTRFKNHLEAIDGVNCLTPRDESLSGGIVTFKMRQMKSTDVSKNLARDYQMRVRNIHENNINGTRISIHVFHSEEEIDRLGNAIAELAKA
ncbi:MAG: aminotransferase class V-fold PLP-dependent enzyme [Deferribacteres bacterium]|nr:aminotransferase class V-fold PLP-dependent enzyme [candidate division KSB1 bacterium]MCB9509546.1 aminotransferase class V-fold PLP-dependent enzyme [Deferribacteres bacterium]